MTQQKRANRYAEPEKYFLIGQNILLLGLSLTALAMAVNVMDSTLLKPFFYYTTAVALVCFCAWLWLSGKVRELPHTQIVLFSAPFLLGLNARGIIPGASNRIPPGRDESSIFLLAALVIFISTAILFQADGQPRRALCWMVWLTGATLAFGFTQGFFPDMFSYVALAAGRDFISTFGNASYFSGFLVLMIPLTAALVYEKGLHGKEQILFAALGLTMISMVLLTGARSAWIACGVSTVLFLLLAVRSRAGWIAFGSIVLVAIAVVAFNTALIESRLTHLFSFDASSSFARRLYFYKGAWSAFLHSPVFGQGTGRFAVFIPRFRPPDFWMVRSEDIVPHAHNEYLEILSESGLIGFAGFVFQIGWILVTVARAIKRSEGAERIRLAGYFCAVIGVLVDNLASFNLRTFPVAFGFWLIAGLAVVESRLKPVAYKPLDISEVYWLRLIPIGAFIAFLWWYVPETYRSYQSSAEFLAGFRADLAGSNQEAADRLEEAVARRPEDAQARFYLAGSYMKLKRYGEGINTIDRLLIENPWYPKARLIRSVCEFESGKKPDAMADLEAELRQSTAPIGYYYGSYFAYRAADTLEELKSLSTLLNNAAACGINDYVVTSLDRYTKLRIARGERTECNELLKAVRSTFRNDAEVLTGVTECYGLLGQTADIRSTFDEASALPDKQEATARRLQQIREHLAATDTSGLAR